MRSNTPWAFYDPDGSCLRTSQPSLLDGPDLMLSSVDLPASGCLQGGRVYALPMLGRHTVVSGGSSLPTPNYRDYKGPPGPGWSEQASLPRAVKMLPTPRSQMGGACSDSPRKARLEQEVTWLLPTPTSQAAKHATDDRGPGSLDDHNLWSVATRLLPTPTVSDTYTDNLASSQQSDGSMHSVTLPQAVRTRLSGASSPAPSTGGNRSSDDGHRLPLTTEDDCPRRSSSG